MFQTKFEEKVKTRISCSKRLFWRSFRLWDNSENLLYSRTSSRDNTTGRMRFACWIK